MLCPPELRAPWRRGRDSNPGQSFWPCNRLAGGCLRPTRPPLRRKSFRSIHRSRSAGGWRGRRRSRFSGDPDPRIRRRLAAVAVQQPAAVGIGDDALVGGDRGGGQCGGVRNGRRPARLSRGGAAADQQDQHDDKGAEPVHAVAQQATPLPTAPVLAGSTFRLPPPPCRVFNTPPGLGGGPGGARIAAARAL